MEGQKVVVRQEGAFEVQDMFTREYQQEYLHGVINFATGFTRATAAMSGNSGALLVKKDGNEIVLNGCLATDASGSLTALAYKTVATLTDYGSSQLEWGQGYLFPDIPDGGSWYGTGVAASGASAKSLSGAIHPAICRIRRSGSTAQIQVRSPVALAANSAGSAAIMLNLRYPAKRFNTQSLST